MRILLTGFGPFLGITDNPSARIVEQLASARSEHDVTAWVLPVSFGRTSEILTGLLGRERFDLVLMLGVAAREREMRLERFGRNRHSGESPDVDGFVPGDAVIAPGAPDLYETPVPLSPLLERLRADGIPVRISEDAGGYVCNHVYFTALHTVSEAALPARCLFVHVPPDTPDFPLAQQAAAVRAVLDSLTTL